ncbi:ABC transporter ATP-binding protein [Streptomyces sp. NPDC000594]|uniref:ABC transporter ATP-binding protein n=1 Tax=Streptomyces sp. NPDC000594 TaxID=3154261 RepID=UPI00331AF2B2
MRYGPKEVLREVSFRAHRGEVLALLGPNGAGKSTTVEILEGFRIRSAGHVRVLGTDPAHGGERWRARLGIVLQSWRDHGNWRVRELLAHLRTYYLPYATGPARPPWPTDELIEAVGLTSHADRRIRTLSGGQRRRLDVAIGIVGRPDVLFLDEPTTGFDPEARHAFHALVRTLVAGDATTVLLTTHDLDEAAFLADRVVILARGRIVADGTPAELARAAAVEDRVSWTQDGRRHTVSAPGATAFVHALLQRHGEAVTGLEVRPASLADTYLAWVRQAERDATAGTGEPR